MRKIYLTEAQLKGYLRHLNEEEYAYHHKVGPFDSQEAAFAELERLRKEKGFSKYDSWIEGNYIILELQKDKFDDDYFGDILTSLNKKYGKVAESRG